MTEQDYQYICKLLRDRSAIVLDDGKQYLVETRLAPMVRQLGLESISDLVQQVRSQGFSNGLATRIIEAMVTSETSFFRDHVPFEAMRTVVLPDLIERRKAERRLALWCAASATGQEPYSLAILMKEHFPQLEGWQVTFIASDLSSECLQRCREGLYSQIEVNRGLPAQLLLRHFKQQGNRWQLSADIRARVRFEQINLADRWPPLPRLDLVLLRNVMIYFDVDTKKRILGRIAQLLRPDGYLLLGGAETTINLDEAYRRVETIKTSVYQLRA